jgi:PAS domain S-box-containing protein
MKTIKKKNDSAREAADSAALRIENETLAQQIRRLIKAESRLYAFQEQLDAQLREYKGLYELNRRLIGTFDIGEMFEYTCEYVINGLEYERVLIFLQGKEAYDYAVSAIDGYYDSVERERVARLVIKHDEPILAPLYKGDEYLICSADSAAGDFADYRQKLAMNEFLIYPLVSHVPPLAFLAVGNTAENAGFYHRVSEDQGSLLGIGNLVGLLASSIENRILYENMNKAFELVKLAEAKYRDIFENAAEGIFQTSVEGKFLSCNPATASILGYDSPDDLISSVTDIERQLYVNPQRRRCLLEMLRNRENVKNFEVEFYRKDRKRRWALLSVHPTFDENGEIIYLNDILLDITERKLAEEALKNLNEELENRVAERTEELAATIENLEFEISERSKAEERAMRLNRLYLVLSEINQVIVHCKDRDTLFSDFCRIAVEDGGFKLAWVGLIDEGSGKVKVVAANGATGYLDDIKITFTEEPEGLGPTVISVREGTYYICNDFLGSPITRHCHEKGRAHGIRASASIALKEEGRVIGALTFYADKKDFFDQQQVELIRHMGEDVSFALGNIVREKRRQEAERALREETAERLLVLEALREKEQMLLSQNRQAAMGEMLGNIAHQWRQPLNALGLMIQQLLMIYDLGQLTREYLEDNVNSSMELVQHMSRTIDDFRNYFRPDKERSEFKVSEAMSNALSLIEDSFKSQHIGIEIVVKDDPAIYGYRNEFAQALLNILNNARDALTERDTEDAKVKIIIWSEDGKAVITISDNAGGIPEKIMGKIFDPYFTTKGPQRGTGIGLFMSKTIIEKNMGGRLTARNIANGAEVRIEV